MNEKIKIALRKIRQEDLVEYKYWKLPEHKYHLFNGPYFKKSTKEEIEIEIRNISKEFEKGNNNPLSQKRIISNGKNKLIGEVSWYWRSRETNWLELGIVIFDENYWGKGIGYEAFKLWIQQIFTSKEEIIRLGITTWSGNKGMVELAKKVGMKKEAEYRKARIINGIYYNSISYGILREEWDDLVNKKEVE